MERIEKFLLGLISRKRKKIRSIMAKLKEGAVEDLEIKKLAGFQNLYRIRMEDIRILVVRKENTFLVFDVDYRKNIYKKLK